MNFKPKKIKERVEDIKTDPEKATKFVIEHLPGTRWPEAEKYIMRDPRWATQYAIGVIHGPWPEAEPYILKNLSYAVNYAAYAKMKLWPELERELDDYSQKFLRSTYNHLMKYYTY
jgi:hypothetical protein